MNIIKTGTKPADRKHTTSCGQCHTKFEFRESEATRVSDSSFRDGDYFDVKCPTCHQSVTIDVTLGLDTSD